MGLRLWRVQGDGGEVADVVAFALPNMQGATALAAAGEPDGLRLEDRWDLASLGGEGNTALADVSVVTPAAHTDDDATYTQFFEGYRAGGGTDEERIDAMIQCESTWTIDPGGYYLGLGQFDPGTWATVSGITGYADPYNPFHQGFNVSVWASIVSPGSRGGWPVCFHAIDW